MSILRFSDPKYNFKAVAFDHDLGEEIYCFEGHNKITPGARALIPKVLGARIGNINVNSNLFGFTKFVLFCIDSAVTEPDCSTMMLNGNFGYYYSDLEPTVLTEINSTSFPCIDYTKTINVEDVVTGICSEVTPPGENESFILGTPTDNYLDICVKVGTGHVPSGQSRFYSVAALIGRSPDGDDTNEYVFALEQFPVMVKTESVSFDFIWQTYF